MTALQHSTLHTPNPTLAIRPATSADFEAIYALFQHILEEGETYSYSAQEMTRERSVNYWLEAAGTHCFVIEDDGVFAGCFALRPCRSGRGAHVANASYIVHPEHRGRGVGRLIGEHSLEHARTLGYKAIQFNFVVSSNKVAVHLWASLGFTVVGTLPKAFLHARNGLVDVYIMHRFL